MKPKSVKVARTWGLPNYSSVRIEWEAELTELELLKQSETQALQQISEKLLSELEAFGKQKGWEK